jgi:hypothetical protein
LSFAVTAFGFDLRVAVRVFTNQGAFGFGAICGLWALPVAHGVQTRRETGRSRGLLNICVFINKIHKNKLLYKNPFAN